MRTLATIISGFAVLGWIGSPTCGARQASHHAAEARHAAVSSSNAASEISIELDAEKQSARVLVDDQLFTAYRVQDLKKPVLYPLNIKPDLSLARHWPLKEVAGEQQDHPPSTNQSGSAMKSMEFCFGRNVPKSAAPNCSPWKTQPGFPRSTNGSMMATQ